MNLHFVNVVRIISKLEKQQVKNHLLTFQDVLLEYVKVKSNGLKKERKNKMENFDLKKYLAEGKLTEAYTPGEGWTADFEYDDMMAHGLTLTADDSIEDLRKVVEDFTDVNYHREAAHLYDAIDSIEAGNRGEAKMYINKFRKEIKNTLAGWDDVNEAQEDKFDIETTEKIAQAIADEFTAEDRELDLKYVVTPGTEESSFDLDVEAGPNTPGPEWKDKNGFGIENYLGDYAGGSFYIKDRIVYNAASRNAKVAYITPEGEIEIISAEDSKADLGMTDDVETDYMERRKEMSDYMEENKKETKSNKMENFDLKKYLAENRLLREEMSEEEMIKKLEASLKQAAGDAKALENEPVSKKNQELNEAVGLTIAALVVGAPGILKVLGKISQAIGWLFGLNKDKEDGKKGNMVSRALEKAGNNLHHFYVKQIAKGLTNAYPNLYDIDRNKKIDATEFRNAKENAEQAYAGMLIAAAIATGWSAAHAANSVVAGLKAAEIGVDVADVAAIGTKLAQKA